MATSSLNRVIQHVWADFGPDGEGMTDGELLGRFLRSRDDNALAALVRRHAPMVWGVCSRLLHKHHDAEDAFQATFLVLVHKAAGVPRQAVANWLYGVARQTAVRLRALAAKRGRREMQVMNMPESNVAEIRDADLQFVLEEELGRLPDHYRGVIILCDLEDMTRKEAARQLGIPEGSVASRLARARVLLAKRLTQRGVVFSGGSVAVLLSALSASASAPPALVASTIKAASVFAAGKAATTTGVISARVAALTEGVVKTMFVTKIKSVLAVVLVIVALAGAAGLIYQTQAAEPPQDSKKVVQAPKPAEKEAPDPAPAGVILDQEQVRYGGCTSARTLPGYTVWQSFTAGKTGTLVHIDMGFANKMSGAGELKIYEGAGTSGEVLQTLKVNVVALDGGVTWNRWSVNVPVVAGRCYTFEFKPDRKTLPDPYGVAIGTPDPYPRGRFGLTDPTGSYPTDFDALFRTWVDTVAGGKKGAGQSQD